MTGQDFKEACQYIQQNEKQFVLSWSHACVEVEKSGVWVKEYKHEVTRIILNYYCQ